MSKYIYNFSVSDQGVYKPKVPILITNPETGDKLHVNALVDTGADRCVIPAMVAMTLGLKLNKEAECKHGTIGISGETLKTWNHLVKIKLLDKDWKETDIELDVISSTIDAKIRVPAIVGTNMFLDKFKVELDYPNNELSLTRNDR